MNNVYVVIGYQLAYPPAAVGQQNDVFHNARVQKLSKNIVGYAAIHSAEYQAVRTVERVHRRNSRLGNGGDAVVDVFDAVYYSNAFKPVLQTLEFRKRFKTFLQIASRLYRRCQRDRDVVEIMLSAKP